MRADTLTGLWQRYQSGRNYNARLTPNKYSEVETNDNFYKGLQWIGLPDTPAVRALPKPVFNILKRFVTLFVASLTASTVAIRTDPLSNTPGGGAEDPAKYANALLENLLEKLNFQYLIRKALFRGAITGDYAFHVFFDPDAPPFGQTFPPNMDAVSPEGEIRMELIEGIDVMFGNPNDRIVENQPYILIIGRDSVSNLRAEARKNQRHGGDPDSIRPDHETADFPGTGGQTELSDTDDSAEDGGAGGGKALYLICYEKQRNADGQVTIHATKATKDGFIYRNVDTRLTFYPLAWGNWAEANYQYHGTPLLTELLPAQIFLNTSMATAMRHLQLTAFPKTIYNADMISAWSNEAGCAIGVRGLQPGQSIGAAAMNLQPGNLSTQLGEFIDRTQALMEKCAGATEVFMGDSRPDNTSALLVLQENAKIPLENARAGLHECAENLGKILLDFAGTYYWQRPLEVEVEVTNLPKSPDGLARLDPVTNLLPIGTQKIRVPVLYDFSQFKDLSFRLRIDSGNGSYFSELATEQTLDNLRSAGVIGNDDYLERLSDRTIPGKRELLEKIRNGGAASMRNAGAGGGLIANALPDNVRQSFDAVQGSLRQKAVSLGIRQQN